jgi:hypothetical protein
VVNLFSFSHLFLRICPANPLNVLAMTRAFRQYPICHRLTIILTLAHLLDFALHKTKITRTHLTLNHPTWPPHHPLSNGNVVLAPPPTRGASTASCALLPTQSARLLLRCMHPLWLQKMHVHLGLAGIPAASSLMLLGLLALTVGAAARSTSATAIFWRMTSLSNFSTSRSLCLMPLWGEPK